MDSCSTQWVNICFVPPIHETSVAQPKGGPYVDSSCPCWRRKWDCSVVSLLNRFHTFYHGILKSPPVQPVSLRHRPTLSRFINNHISRLQGLYVGHLPWKWPSQYLRSMDWGGYTAVSLRLPWGILDMVPILQHMKAHCSFSTHQSLLPTTTLLLSRKLTPLSKPTRGQSFYSLEG